MYVTRDADLLHGAGLAVGAELCHAEFVIAVDLGAVGDLVVGGPGRSDAFAADQTGDFRGLAVREGIGHAEYGTPVLRIGDETELLSVRAPAGCLSTLYIILCLC